MKNRAEILRVLFVTCLVVCLLITSCNQAATEEEEEISPVEGITENGEETSHEEENIKGEEEIFSSSKEEKTEIVEEEEIVITPRQGEKENFLNEDPVADDDRVTTDEDTPVIIAVLSNDNDVDGDTLTVTSVTAPASGMVAINADNTVTYTPALNYNGEDSFNYTVDDGYGGTDTATVAITVSPVNDLPFADDDIYSVGEDNTLQISSPGVLKNDTDVDGASLTAILESGPDNGTLTLNPDGSFIYAHDGSETTSDSFVYRVNDGFEDSNTATVEIVDIDIEPPNITITSPVPQTVNITSAVPQEQLNLVFAVKSPIKIIGNITDLGSGIASVTCNEIPLSISDSSFSHEVDLEVGSNQIEIIATDNAGNVASSIITVDFDDIEFLVQNYAPILRFHPSEIFLPDSVDSVLKDSLFQWGLVQYEYNYDLFNKETIGTKRLVELSDPADLEAAQAIAESCNQSGNNDFRTWIVIPESSKPGNIERAKSYVRLNRWFGTNTLEVQFWYFYPYNGPGQFRISVWGQDLYVLLPDNDEGIGKHYGDWECVILRFSRDELLSVPYTLQWVGMSAHGHIKVFPITMVQLYDKHPIIYAAHESHAHYETAWPYNEDYWRFYYKKMFDSGIATGYLFDIIAYLPPHSCEFEIGDENKYEVISAEITGYGVNQSGTVYAEWIIGAHDVQEPKWLAFQGRWGHYEKLSYTFEILTIDMKNYKEVSAGPTGPKMKPEWLAGWLY